MTLSNMIVLFIGITAICFVLIETIIDYRDRRRTRQRLQKMLSSEVVIQHFISEARRK